MNTIFSLKFITILSWPKNSAIQSSIHSISIVDINKKPQYASTLSIVSNCLVNFIDVISKNIPLHNTTQDGKMSLTAIKENKKNREQMLTWSMVSEIPETVSNIAIINLQVSFINQNANPILKKFLSCTMQM